MLNYSVAELRSINIQITNAVIKALEEPTMAKRRIRTDSFMLLIIRFE